MLLRPCFLILPVVLFAAWGALTRTPIRDVQASERAVAGTRGTRTGTETMPDDPPQTCRTTRPPVQPFVPPSPYPAKPPDPGHFWFGTEKLWTMLPADGTWLGLPHYRPTDSAYRQKIFWWRKGYYWRAEPNPRLTVTGRRLDAPAPPLQAKRASNGYRAEDLKSFMVVAIDIPTLGCWEITGDYEGHELSFVVWVAE